MTKIQIQGYSLSCQIPSSGTDTCILFLHGLQSRKEIFEDIRQALSNCFTIPHLAIDFIGFGHSDKPENFSYDLAGQQHIVLELLRKLDIKNVHIIGHSRGGMLGTLMIKDVPNVVRSLVSLEGNLCLEDCGESRKVAALPFDEFKNTYYPALKEKLAQSTEPSAQFRYQSLLLIPDYAFYKTSKATVAWSKKGQLKDIFQSSPHPKLMVYGQNSHFHSRPTGKSVSLAEIPESGHFMMLDNPDATLDVIQDFLTRLLHNP